MNRRRFLAGLGAGAAGVALRPEDASAFEPGGPNTAAMLVDTTLCAGCRACEVACSESNGLEAPVTGDDVFDRRRETDATCYTVVNRVGETASGEPVYAKTQCHHCIQPGCASACPVRAMEKTALGPVVYHRERCIGCRYCMIACPFGRPKYEFDHLAPYVQKCSFCAQRQREGKLPACATVCPTGALTFGKRHAIIEEAKRRIYTEPDRYIHHVYGEKEVGGTSWMYIGAVPFEQIGLPPSALIGEISLPQRNWLALSAVPLIMTVWPPLLMGLRALARRRDATEAPEEDDDGQPHRR